MKNYIRKQYLLKRDKLTAEYIKKSELDFLEVFNSSFLDGFTNYMTYFPIKNEASVNKISHVLFQEKKNVSLPVTMEDDSIIPVKFLDFDHIALGKYNIPEPTTRIKVKAQDIEVILVPGAVFDYSGGRLGYGKGCYDRFLSNINSIKVGVCYEFQIYKKELHQKSHDIRMNYLLTEKKLYEV